MARPIQIQILERARALIADEQHWCRGHLAVDADGFSVCPTSVRAVERCALGAIISAAYDLTRDFDAAFEVARKALKRMCSISTLVSVNDMMGHAAALELLDTAIAREAAA